MPLEQEICEAHSARSTSFVSRQVNASTFLIIEDDKYGEQPHIYVKIYSNHLLINDTGCNAPRRKKLAITSLRHYLETYPMPCYNKQILNPKGKKGYIIICSHCHYDHILGIPQFLSADPIIVASSFDKAFILEDLPIHSLCTYIDLPTPKYEISYWARQFDTPQLETELPLRIQFLQIPGHTPCSLAWYDIDEHHLYVGDAFYERKRAIPIPELPDDVGQIPGLPATQAAIIFPQEGGNWIQYMESLDLLISFTRHQNEKLRRQYKYEHDHEHEHHRRSQAAKENIVPLPIPRVLVSCGHLTISADAEKMLDEVNTLFWRIINGKVPVTSSGTKRGVIYDLWVESEDDSKYSVMAPRCLVEEARKHFNRHLN